MGGSVSELALSFRTVSRIKTSWVGRFLEGKIALEVLRALRMTSPGDPQGGGHRRGTVLAT